MTFFRNIFIGALASSLFVSGGAQAQRIDLFTQAVAEFAAEHDAIAEFYRTNGYEAIWTGEDDFDRRQALMTAMAQASFHALPVTLYNTQDLTQLLSSADSARNRGRVEVALTALYLSYARDIQTGIIDNPNDIDDGIARRGDHRDPAELLQELNAGVATEVFANLIPQNPEYTRLMGEKQRLERLMASGGWGETVPGGKIEPGDSGSRVIALRDRLIRLGYLARSASATYDEAMQAAVQAFQQDHGLNIDGVVGESTLAHLNASVEERLRAVIVAMERERWLHRDMDGRQILVNLVDYHARILDDGVVTFETRSVVGMNMADRRSPEFSDEMEHMIINPTWNVPRSIAVNEYLPQLQENPNAASYLNITDARGQVVSREEVDFSQYTETDFPFDLSQPPSNRNALGLVKFMFPNRHNIYLHDTPQDHLFARERRAYSHGCIRLNEPFEFAYAILAVQSDDPVGLFHSTLNTGREAQIDLEQHIPVHLIYRTAIIPAQGRPNYRFDLYGRDAKIWRALQNAGVELGSVQS